MKKTITLLILLCCCTLSLWAQEKEISGKITASDDGQPIPGVSVTVKGTNRGTATDVNGNFSIRAGAAEILVFRSIGFLPKEVLVGSQSKISVALASDNQNLSEVVVTALGIKRSEKSLGYATQAVKGSDLTLTKEQNVIGALAGKIAGVQVTGSSGASMGGTQKIKIRSVNSLTGTGSPLMVVDGTPISQDNFSDSNANGVDYGNTSQDINPDDIESINVLKGPAASALYGIRGQYGVLLITTKKGAKGAKKVEINVSSAFSIEKVGNFMPLQNTYGVGNNQTFLTLANGQKYVNGNDESWGPKLDGTPVRMFYSFYPQDPDFGKLTPFVPQPNNIKDYFETGQNINNGISITGGGENSSIRLSYNNAYINGTIPNTWLKRNNLSLSSSLDITKKLTIGANVNYANNSGQRPTQGYQGSFTGAVQWFQRNIDINRLRNYRYPDGTIMNWNVNPNTTTGLITNNRPSDWNNPFFDAYQVLNNDSRDRLFGDVNVSYQVLPELKLSGFLRSDMYSQTITHKEASGGRNLSGYSINKYQNTDNNYEFLAQYAKKWGDLSLNANLGGNIFTTKYTETKQATVGGLSAPDTYTMAASVDRPTSTSRLVQKSVRSAYAMVSLGYKDTYFLDASLRNDNSSALPKDNNSYWYPSVSGSFLFSELLKSNILSYGKLRASYAIAGSDLDPYQISPTYGFGGVYAPPSGSINTIYVPDKLLNPFLKPSFGYSYETGLDLKFLKNRLGLELTLYQQKNKDQVINLYVSGASGYETAVVNAGLIENKGVELALNGRPVQSKMFTWDMAFNFARNKNSIKEIYALAPDLRVYQLDANTYSSQTITLNASLGAAFGNLIGPGYIRDAATGKVMLGTDNMPLYDPAKDFGSVLPKYTGGFRNNFRIWKFDVAAMIDFQKGGQFFSWSKMLATKSGQSAETAAINDKGFNIRDAVANGGGVKVNGISAATGQEVTAYVDARAYYRNNLGTRIYDEWIYDASYIKMREISVGYNFDADFLKKTPIKALKLSLMARNPFMIWQKAPKGVDPSELSSGSASISWIEKGELQTVRSYGVSLNLTF
ncbi:SusC/RagA family TonB-linked outer membrane protein [Pedobacter sp. HMWF019]|uniref:SusC/RagA family TonB-linked outer membrane protein n=1 Tax=Pedobacter sp. HMWF019 TaxID=2056856 RepID=UPI000D3D57A3|nr:SusC/RagA family TonB-linked outer membrane protein [Pedobacter sp. HMWF019]PTT04109.1 SusC/RagA family TonB-linked outer membrane protein [Pedobacter sp. HMWF019]